MAYHMGNIKKMFVSLRKSHCTYTITEDRSPLQMTKKYSGTENAKQRYVWKKIGGATLQFYS